MASEDNVAMDVDIIGFSRGASQARDFANQIAMTTRDGMYRYTLTNAHGTTRIRCQRINFRFMGLWDTVLSTNSGRGYNLAIPDEFASGAHAVALNEYRSNTSHPYGSVGAFPLESITTGTRVPAPPNGQSRIERGFIGAHADIGGGFGSNESQLAQVALAWMINQATAAGVNMAPAPATIIANPVIHDKSDSILTGTPASRAEDRRVRFIGSTSPIRQTTFIDGMSYADTQALISYLPVDDPRRRNFVTGTVDMTAYLRWLNDHGYGINMTVQ